MVKHKTHQTPAILSCKPLPTQSANLARNPQIPVHLVSGLTEEPGLHGLISFASSQSELCGGGSQFRPSKHEQPSPDPHSASLGSPAGGRARNRVGVTQSKPRTANHMNQTFPKRVLCSVLVRSALGVPFRACSFPKSANHMRICPMAHFKATGSLAAARRRRLPVMPWTIVFHRPRDSAGEANMTGETRPVSPCRRRVASHRCRGFTAYLSSHVQQGS